MENEDNVKLELWKLCKYDSKNVYDKRFEERRQWINRTFEELEKTDLYRSNDEIPNFSLNQWLVNEVIERYFMEVARIKQFHPRVENTSTPKVAAYLANWIARIKPVQILVPLTNENKHLIYINEDLAIFVGFSVFGGVYKLIPFNCPQLNELRYHLRYRVMHADNLAMAFEGYETMHLLYNPPVNEKK